VGNAHYPVKSWRFYLEMVRFFFEGIDLAFEHREGGWNDYRMPELQFEISTS
jgi:hypothetical protein